MKKGPRHQFPQIKGRSAKLLQDQADYRIQPVKKKVQPEFEEVDQNCQIQKSLQVPHPQNVQLT